MFLRIRASVLSYGCEDMQNIVMLNVSVVDYFQSAIKATEISV